MVVVLYLRRVSVAARAAVRNSNPADGVVVGVLYLLCVVYVVAAATSRSLLQMSPAGCMCA